MRIALVIMPLTLLFAGGVKGESPLPVALQELSAPPPEFARPDPDLRSPLLFESGEQVRRAEDWTRRRAEILADWHQKMGAQPEALAPPAVTILDTVYEENITRHHIRFRWTPAEETEAYLLIPDTDETGPRPAVLTVYYEPETAVGLGKEDRDFAIALSRRGFITLSIGTTEATAAKTYSLYHPSVENATVAPLSMLAYAAGSAFDVLAARPEVDAKRIGIVGHSFGGKWAMFASCLDDRFACAAWSDPGIIFETRPSVNYWEPWYLGYHPPPWRDRGVPTAGNPARGLYPQLLSDGYNLHELHALMAPRPFLVSGGSEDPSSRWSALNHSRAVNRLLGHEDRVFMHNRPDHSPNPGSNEVIYDFFDHWLR